MVPETWTFYGTANAGNIAWQELHQLAGSNAGRIATRLRQGAIETLKDYHQTAYGRIFRLRLRCHPRTFGAHFVVHRAGELVGTALIFFDEDNVPDLLRTEAAERFAELHRTHPADYM